MDYVKIGGKSYDVIVTELSENFTIMYSENSQRVMSVGSRMILDPLGTLFGHKITFSRKSGSEQEFDELFDFVSMPRYEGIWVEIVHNQKTIGYEAFVSSGERFLKKIDKKTGKVYWNSLTLNIVPIEAQVMP